MQLELTSLASMRSAVDAVLQTTNNRLFGLFNNGTYGQPGAMEDLSRALLLEQFETNLFGWHELTCQQIPVMRQ